MSVYFSFTLWEEKPLAFLNCLISGILTLSLLKKPSTNMQQAPRSDTANETIHTDESR